MEKPPDFDWLIQLFLHSVIVCVGILLFCALLLELAT
jgi:hypothetical protein